MSKSCQNLLQNNNTPLFLPPNHTILSNHNNLNDCNDNCSNTTKINIIGNITQLPNTQEYTKREISSTGWNPGDYNNTNYVLNEEYTLQGTSTLTFNAQIEILSLPDNLFQCKLNNLNIINDNQGEELWTNHTNNSWEKLERTTSLSYHYNNTENNWSNQDYYPSWSINSPIPISLYLQPYINTNNQQDYIINISLGSFDALQTYENLTFSRTGLKTWSNGNSQDYSNSTWPGSINSTYVNCINYDGYYDNSEILASLAVSFYYDRGTISLQTNSIYQNHSGNNIQNGISNQHMQSNQTLYYHNDNYYDNQQEKWIINNPTQTSTQQYSFAHTQAESPIFICYDEYYNPINCSNSMLYHESQTINGTQTINNQNMCNPTTTNPNPTIITPTGIFHNITYYKLPTITKSSYINISKI